MKKILLGIGILGGILFVAFLVARLTGVLQFYSIPTPGNEPTLKQGSVLFATSLKKAKRLDFVCYEDRESESIYIFRLCGIAGDKVELKKGVLYLNDQNIDKNLKLMHNYCIKRIAYDSLVEIGLATPGSIHDMQENGVFASVVDSVAYHTDGVNLDCNSFVAVEYPMIKEIYGQDWTPNNFGPIIVPRDSIFVLGDNRDNAFDSRFSGFIAEDAIRQTALVD